MKPHLVAFDEIKPDRIPTALEALLGPEAYEILMTELTALNELKITKGDNNG